MDCDWRMKASPKIPNSPNFGRNTKSSTNAILTGGGVEIDKSYDILISAKIWGFGDFWGHLEVPVRTPMKGNDDGGSMEVTLCNYVWVPSEVPTDPRVFSTTSLVPVAFCAQ